MKMSTGPNKTEAMHFPAGDDLPAHAPIKIGDAEYKFVESYKYLGHHITRRLTSESMANDVIKRAWANYLRYFEHSHVTRYAGLATQKQLFNSVVTGSINNLLSMTHTNPALLDTVHVDYYGSMLPLSQVANLSLIDARTIGIQPWEKSMAAKIEKAIRESDLGLNPASMGELIRVPMPMMTEERRRELTKVVRNEGEAAKIAIRNLRRDANEAVKKLVKDKLASEDEQKRSEADIQKLTDRQISEIDRLVAGKEQDIMAV
jgi:ribosome recycling factor